jgi:hypothetical protein
MRIESVNVTIPAWVLIVCAALLVGVGAVAWYYFLDANDAKMVGFVGGIVSGLLIFILTFAMSVGPLRKLDRFERMGIQNLLENRHEKSYYAGVLVGARKIVRVMGASCTRFVDDFLDIENEDHSLIEAIQKHNRLRIQLLIPDDDHISDDAKARVPAMLRKLEKVHAQFGDRVQIRRFPEKAQHSFIISDDQLIAGPVFEGDNSRHAPAVHVVMSTRYAQKYDDFFERVWNSCA